MFIFKILWSFSIESMNFQNIELEKIIVFCTEKMLFISARCFLDKNLTAYYSKKKFSNLLFKFDMIKNISIRYILNKYFQVFCCQ